MSLRQTLFTRIAPTEVGQSLVMFGVGGVAILGLVGMVVDAGQVVGARTEMQKAADAAAFAGAQELPNSTAAVAAAHQFVHSNSASGTNHTFSVTTDKAKNDTLTVTTTRKVNYTFLRVLGLSGSDVSATATTRRGLYSGGTGLIPWGFIASNDSNSALLQNSCFVMTDADGLPVFKTKTQCTVKYGSGYHAGGDFGALRLDAGDSGSNDYRDRVKYGSVQPHYIGEQVPSEPGNMRGPTREAVAYRLAQPPPKGCAGVLRDQVLQDNPDGSVSIRPNCEDSARIVVIPVVDKIDHQSKSTIVGFAMMFLLGESGNGGQTTVRAEFIRLVTPLPGGEYSAGTVNGASTIFLTR